MITWDVDPIFFSWKFINLRYYSFAFIIGFAFSYKYFLNTFKKEGRTNYEDLTSSLFTHIILATIIGSRLGHILFYEPSILWTDPIEVFQVWKGGLASHGGYLAVIISSYLFLKKAPGFSYMWLMDRVAPCSVFTGGLIRIGNLMNSEIVGKPTDGTWGFIFTRLNDNIPRHPTQIYEAIGYFTISITAFLLIKKFYKKWVDGRVFGFMLVFAFSFRLFVEFFKENQVSFEQSMTLNMGQLLSVPFILIGFYFMLGLHANNLKLKFLTEPVVKFEERKSKKKNKK
ncbi:MAG: prolipoprotein diacylglyceryl transferase [Bdellovibrionales bacterium]|nr:prolipoprotein diacylglyceryl transferase [Bdellovibrionales bacterium]